MHDYDVVVIGGGPAGSTVATLLSQWGRRVLLLEKEHFPRHHIGESLLPLASRVMQRLGVLDKVERANFVHADLDAETFSRMQEERGESLAGLMLSGILKSPPTAMVHGESITFAARRKKSRDDTAPVASDSSSATACKADTDMPWP